MKKPATYPGYKHITDYEKVSPRGNDPPPDVPGSREKIVCNEPGPARVLTINAPQTLNALDLEATRTLTNTLQKWARSSIVSMIVIKGKDFLDDPQPSFCTGTDHVALYEYTKAGQKERCAELLKAQFDLIYTLANVRKPIFTLMNGLTVGLGASLGAFGSVPSVDRSAILSLPECSLGLVPAFGSTYFLTRFLPPGMGMMMALTGKRIRADDILHSGLAAASFDSLNTDLFASMVNESSGHTLKGVFQVFDEFESSEQGRFMLRPYLDMMRRCFWDQETLQDTIEALRSEKMEFARYLLRKMSHQPALSLKATYRLMKNTQHRESVIDWMPRSYAHHSNQHHFRKAVQAIRLSPEAYDHAVENAKENLRNDKAHTFAPRSEQEVDYWCEQFPHYSRDTMRQMLDKWHDSCEFFDSIVPNDSEKNQKMLEDFKRALRKDDGNDESNVDLEYDFDGRRMVESGVEISENSSVFDDAFERGLLGPDDDDDKTSELQASSAPRIIVDDGEGNQYAVDDQNDDEYDYAGTVQKLKLGDVTTNEKEEEEEEFKKLDEIAKTHPENDMLKVLMDDNAGDNKDFGELDWYSSDDDFDTSLGIKRDYIQNTGDIGAALDVGTYANPVLDLTESSPFKDRSVVNQMTPISVWDNELEATYLVGLHTAMQEEYRVTMRLLEKDTFHGAVETLIFNQKPTTNKEQHTNLAHVSDAEVDELFTPFDNAQDEYEPSEVFDYLGMNLRPRLRQRRRHQTIEKGAWEQSKSHLDVAELINQPEIQPLNDARSSVHRGPVATHPDESKLFQYHEEEERLASALMSGTAHELEEKHAAVLSDLMGWDKDQTDEALFEQPQPDLSGYVRPNASERVREQKSPQNDDDDDHDRYAPTSQSNRIPRDRTMF